MISVVIPVYNGQLFLQAALDSVIAQDNVDIEILAINDGSTDNSQAIIDKYVNQYPKIMRAFSQSNRGVAAARNRGISEAKGEYISFLDQDDIWYNNKLSQQADALMKNPDVGLVTCSFQIIDFEGKQVPDMRYPVLQHSDCNVKNEMLIKNVIGPPCCVLVRKECFSKVGSFDQSLAGPEDRDMWLRICKEYAFHFIREVLCGVRVHDSNAHKNVPKMKENQIKFIMKHKSSYEYLMCRRAFGFVYLDAAREYNLAGQRYSALVNAFMSILMYPFKIDPFDNKYKLLLKSLIG
jgi:O-antigen biosynthesis protein